MADPDCLTSIKGILISVDRLLRVGSEQDGPKIAIERHIEDEATHAPEQDAAFASDGFRREPGNGIGFGDAKN